MTLLPSSTDSGGSSPPMDNKPPRDNAAGAGWLYRFLALSALFGLSPFFWGYARRHPNAWLTVRMRQGNVVHLLFLTLLALFAVGVLVLSWVMVRHRDFYDAIQQEALFLSIFRKALIIFVVLYCYEAVLIVIGSSGKIPWVGRLGRFSGVSHLANVGLISVFIFIGCFIFLGWRGENLAAGTDSAKAYFLYEDVEGRFPRALFAFGYYPSLSAAAKKWGRDEVVLLPISDINIKKSLNNGEYVFVGSHGTEEGILLKSGFITPDEIKAMGDHPRLRFVYLAGCDSGAQRRQWEEAFHPARLVTYDRLVPTLEHVWWLWFRGPAEIAAL